MTPAPPNTPPPVSPITATYRLQLTPDFTFNDAAAITSYLARLGISHLYLSPIFEARPGSTHGYDQTDPTQIRAALGGPHDPHDPHGFDHLAATAAAHELRIVLDIVPNHMAAHFTNPWWRGLLQHGPGSTSDRYFDVAWEANDNRIVLPILGAPLDDCIDRGELTIEPADQTSNTAAPTLRYFDHRFPLRPDSPLPPLPPAPSDLRRLLAQQHYELAFWRTGLARINYRRFFDIADLAGLRIEDDEVFDTMHARTLELVRGNKVHALRIDHIDGLKDPAAYLRRLRAALDTASPTAHVPILIEKILAHDEDLPDDWPTDGATGYEFLAALTQLTSSPAGVHTLRSHPEAPVDPTTRESYRILMQAMQLARITRFRASGLQDRILRAHAEPPADESAFNFHQLTIHCKCFAAATILAPELDRLTARISAALTDAAVTHERAELKLAIIELSAHLTPYRTYIDDRGITDTDRARITTAAAAATDADPATLAAFVGLLTLAGPFARPRHRDQAIAAAQRWQQFTGPLAAKGVEDTALYRDTATPWLNDVGAEPILREPAAIITHLAAQRDDRPLSLNATDTHDAKRSEDVRARLATLSRHPDRWIAALAAARELLAAGDHTPPDPRDTSLILASLFALMPIDTDAGAPIDEPLAARITAYITKAAREAKLNTSWLDPNSDYEKRCADAVSHLCANPDAAALRAQLATLAHTTRPAALRISVAMILAKTLFPGVPDFYQGTEFAALALVDPDNRRPIDFTARTAALEQLDNQWSADPAACAAAHLPLEPATSTTKAHTDTALDRAKLFTTRRALTLRRALIANDKSASIRLINPSFNHTTWSWTAATPTIRCTIQITLDPSTEPPAPEALNQLTARTNTPAWLSATCESNNTPITKLI